MVYFYCSATVSVTNGIKLRLYAHREPVLQSPTNLHYPPLILYLSSNRAAQTMLLEATVHLKACQDSDVALHKRCVLQWQHRTHCQIGSFFFCIRGVFCYDCKYMIRAVKKTVLVADQQRSRLICVFVLLPR